MKTQSIYNRKTRELFAKITITSLQCLWILDGLKGLANTAEFQKLHPEAQANLIELIKELDSITK